MRPIKFRAWDKELNNWYEPIYEAYKGNLFDITISLSGYIIARDSKEAIGGMNTPIHMDKYNDRFELMQFTGLIDKNGKEIYEGDVIIFGDTKIRQIVEYRKGQYVAKQIGTVGSLIGLGYCDWEKISEVIGNIYENPDLLK